VIGLAVNQLVREGVLDAGVVDGKASHYPGAAFVEFVGLIAGDRKAEIQRRVDGTYTIFPLALFPISRTNAVFRARAP
jgi:hypothetical protein